MDKQMNKIKLQTSLELSSSNSLHSDLNKTSDLLKKFVTKGAFVTGVNRIGKLFYTIMCVWVHMQIRSN